MSAADGKPFLEIKESRLMSFVIAFFVLILALCAPFALDHLVGTLVAIGGVYYSFVHWRRFFSGNRVTLRVDAAGLSGTMVSRDGVIPWSDVASCAKAHDSEDYKISLKNGKVIKISQFEMPVSSGLGDYVNSRLTR